MVEATGAISEHAMQLHRDAIVIDNLSFYYDGPTGRFIPEKLTALNVTAAEVYDDWAKGLEEITLLREDMKRDPTTVLIRSAQDIENAKADGKVGVILGVQSSIFIETELWRLGVLHDAGLRILQLTYNERSYMGDGCLEDEDGGLTRFGKRVLDEMYRLGLALDLSHVGRRTSVEAIHAYAGKPMFSHANPNTLTKNPRNLTDEQIDAIGEHDGLIGICTWGPLCWKNNTEKAPDVNDVIDHMVYVADRIGIDHVGLSTDSACTENTAWLIQHSLEFNASYPEIATEYNSYHGGRGVLPEINTLDTVTDAMVKRGFRDDEILGVIGRNALNHFRSEWKG